MNEILLRLAVFVLFFMMVTVCQELASRAKSWQGVLAIFISPLLAICLGGDLVYFGDTEAHRYQAAFDLTLLSIVVAGIYYDHRIRSKQR